MAPLTVPPPGAAKESIRVQPRSKTTASSSFAADPHHSGQLRNNTHTILGTVVDAALLLQPFLGYMHHRRYLSTQKRTAWTHVHIWYGRLLILLGIDNGGLGLHLASDTPAHSRAGTVVYSVLAGIVGAGLLALITLVTVGRKGRKSEREG
ncbi:hypothetical protein QBC33DRAFT_522492 [Phialemonium atrogriseum]|uniref:Cytochrome b561 domain-containing protein n=1 Tax=Phialemonium atrogriseum TaxID=1093897 RepID=A0AAJ0C9U0_9PEZI|nr:uncharacterized protein QBC33DRAFT_522492 [Phialemonium atrogriseum]KAK1772790.1 hypothetical protein QBC33DRAFT_522492 [Phialemonium atrogriseum]